MVRNCHFFGLFPSSADFFFLRCAQTGKSEIDILDVHHDMETIFVINAKL